MSVAHINPLTYTLPNSISGCSLWLDGNDPSGTGVLPANGATVSTWIDKSSNAYNASGGVSPTYNSSEKAVSFNGSSWLTTSYSSVPTNETSFIVFQTTTTALAANCFMIGPTNNGGRLLLSVNENDGFGLSFKIGSYFVANGSRIVHAQNKVYLGTATVASTTSCVYLNGIQGPNSSLTYSGTGTTQIGTAASGGLPAAFYIGYIYEIIMYNSLLSVAQRQNVEGYLAQKWNLKGSLPAFHPGIKAPLYPTLIKNRVLNVAKTGVFYPTSVASCQLWLDASDPTLFSYSSGTTIQQWTDKSGYGLNALSNSVIGWAAPTYVAGNPAYVSMQPNQALYVPGFPYNTAWSVFSCMNNFSLGARWYISPYSDLGIVLMGMSQPGNKVWPGMLAGDGDITGSHIEYTTAQNTNGTGIYSYFRDGTQIGTNTIGNGVPSATVRMGIGANGAATYDIGGTYYPYEILIYNQYLGSNDRQTIEGYLAWKWGLQGSLPAGHPYKSASPGSASRAPMRSIINLSRDTGGSFQFTTTPSQYLSIPNNTAFTQNTAFTYEFWYYPTSVNSGYLITMLQGSWLTLQWSRHGAGTMGVDMSYVGDPPGYVRQNRTYAINRWHHVALTWNGTNGVLYMNGVSEAVFTGAGASVDAGNPLLIGQYQGQGQPTPLGYITNFRWVKGISVYTGAFTPPTKRLTVTQSVGTNISAITAGQTQLLISAVTSGSLLTDGSTNNFTITNNGSVAWTALTPFT